MSQIPFDTLMVNILNLPCYIIKHFTMNIRHFDREEHPYIKKNLLNSA